MNSVTWVLLALALGWGTTACAEMSQSQMERQERIEKSPQHHDGRFVNPNGVINSFFSFEMVKVSARYVFEERIDPTPVSSLPVRQIQPADWKRGAAENFAFAWLGHSSLLISAEGVTILVDPVFEERASPYKWMGPKRFHPPPVIVADLPPIDVVLVTHDHYDHLEQSTVVALASEVRWYLVPLGVGKLLEEWGVPPEKIMELDWWESRQVGPLAFHATPAIHYSSRGLFDTDKRLWCSWSVRGNRSSFFVSGDSGYFDGFKEVGERLGPFDIAFLKIGSSDESWKNVHMLPEEAAQQFLDIRGQVMMPTHWATFDLALHPWYEPIERLIVAAEEKKIALVTPRIGERIEVKNPVRSDYWWREVAMVNPDDQ
jgi:L-ascorbate metabolism protein UlaG (beta-lactamase superfamily)